MTGSDAPPAAEVDRPATVEVAPVATATAGEPPRSGALIIERILRDREGLWQEIRSEQRLNGLIRQMLISSVISLALYGLVLGASGSPLQVISSAIKLPLLFLLTLGICLPTLYLFNLVFGARLSIRQALALVLVAITVTGALTLAFAPISLFFLVTADDYSFFKLLNVAILMLTGFVGLSVMVDGMRGMNRLSGHEPAAPTRPTSVPVYSAMTHEALPAGGFTDPAEFPAPLNGAKVGDGPLAAETPPALLDRPVNTRLLYVWVLLFGFVGTQLAWTLRPFIGEPNHPFQLFRSIDGSFYANVIETLGHLL